MSASDTPLSSIINELNKIVVEDSLPEEKEPYYEAPDTNDNLFNPFGTVFAHDPFITHHNEATFTGELRSMLNYYELNRNLVEMKFPLYATTQSGRIFRLEHIGWTNDKEDP